MALGGGIFITQNKVLPGSYINFVSVAKATATLSDRGFAAMGLELDWGEDGQIFEVTQSDFQKDSMRIFGYSYSDDKMKGIRDLFKNIQILYTYKLTSGGVKASNDFAIANCCGVRGNDIKIVIQTNIDDNDKFDVQTWFDGILVDVQTVGTSAELVVNDYVTFDNDAELELTAGVSLSGGTNGTVNTTSHQTFLDKIESYPQINAVGYVGTDNTIKSLYVAFTERMRNEVGVKFVTVLYNKAADHEGVVNVKNTVLDTSANQASLVYWTTGVMAGTAINTSATNKVYDGEYTVNVDYTQSQLEAAIRSGEFTFHQVGNDVRVLTDINSLVTTTVNKGEDFKSNQTIRVLDQIATDIASLFATKYLGVIPNDADGRTSLWNDIVKHHQQLLSLRAIEDFTEEDVQVEQGDTKKSVVVSDAVTIVNAMEKLYMTVMVA